MESRPSGGNTEEYDMKDGKCEVVQKKYSKGGVVVVRRVFVIDASLDFIPHIGFSNQL
jgi:hypothetical protein